VLKPFLRTKATPSFDAFLPPSGQLRDRIIPSRFRVLPSATCALLSPDTVFFPSHLCFFSPSRPCLVPASALPRFREDECLFTASQAYPRLLVLQPFCFFLAEAPRALYHARGLLFFPLEREDLPTVLARKSPYSQFSPLVIRPCRGLRLSTGFFFFVFYPPSFLSLAPFTNSRASSVGYHPVAAIA